MSRSDVTDLAARAQACVDAGKLLEAKHLFGELCRIAPDNAEAWLMAGALHGETGSPEEALACLNTAIRIAPDYPEAHLTLAHLHKASGSLNACYDSTRRALEIDANYDEAWVLLGAVCCELRYYEEAKRASREAISRWPENVQAHFSLATALCHLGRESDAESVVKTAIGLEGGNQPMVGALLGQIFLGKGEYEKAEAAYRSIIENAPELAAAWSGLCSALQGQYKLKAAEDACRQAVALEADNVPSVHKLALLQEINGDFSGAVESLKLVLARKSGQIDLIGTLAGVLEKQGDFDEAIQMLEPVVAGPEKNVRVALVFQRLCRKMARCTEAASYLEALLANEALGADDRAMLHFSLGDLYDRDAAYDLAFEHYDNANHIDPPVYNPGDYGAYVDSVTRAFSPLNISSLPLSNNCSAQPVFIVGMPRSGTSLVERVLSSHSAVFAAGELRNVIELADEVAMLAGGGQYFPAGVDQLVQADVDRLSGKYLEAIAAMADGAARVTDKLPHNFQYIGLISRLFPAAKIIHCVRDARDTCLSCYCQNFAGYHPYASNLEYLGRHYQDYQRLMAHWRSLDIPMLEIPYEALVENTEAWSRKLVEYCGLGWEEQCLRYYESGQLTSTASYDQVRQPIYKSSISRWKRYRAHLSPLLDVL